jgi:hypothetical protein
MGYGLSHSTFFMQVSSLPFDILQSASLAGSLRELHSSIFFTIPSACQRELLWCITGSTILISEIIFALVCLGMLNL